MYYRIRSLIFQRNNNGESEKQLEACFVKYGGRDLELVMPPMDEKTKLDKMRFLNYMLDMLLKYIPAFQAEKENRDYSS